MKRNSGFHEDLLQLNHEQRTKAMEVATGWYNHNQPVLAIREAVEAAYYETLLEYLTPEEEDAVCDFIEGVTAKTGRTMIHLKKGLYKIALAQELNKMIGDFF